MRISDWSSDVCSSDLRQLAIAARLARRDAAQFLPHALLEGGALDVERNVALHTGLLDGARHLIELRAKLAPAANKPIGRATCRERVCKNVQIYVVAGSHQKTKQST